MQLVLVLWEPWEGTVSRCRPLHLVLGAGIIWYDRLHWVEASGEGLPRQSWLNHLLVGSSRVIMVIWYLVIGPSRTTVVIVPWSMWGRMGR